MTQSLQLDHPAHAYARLAPHYDSFTSGYDHETWVCGIEAIWRSLGQSGRRALDIGCGTGRSSLPLFERGYSVLACDISPEMVQVARDKFPSQSDSFFVADMRELPRLGKFDLALCLDDCLNYLLSDDDLAATFAGVSGLLSSTGMFVFDVNSLLTYRKAFAATLVRESEHRVFAWRGEAQPGHTSGATAAATVDVFAERNDGLWERSSSRHVQRHHSEATIRRLLDDAGLECRACVGQSTGALLETTVDEQRHTKVVYFASPRLSS